MRLGYTLLAIVIISVSAIAADAPESARLVGTWKLPGKDVEMVVTFEKDGTFTHHMKAGDHELSMSGTWKLEGDKLTQVCVKSSRPDRVGKDHTLTITKLTDDKLVMQDGTGKEDEIALDRVK